MTTITITCKIPRQLDARLEAAAKEQRVSKSQIVRQAIQDRLKRNGASKRLHAFDLVKHLSGSVRGRKDLSTHSKYLEGFGA
ncbi:MAG TPA: ribbon-helix-helix protein, CopG family [Tepidisphaeraceae bacterium]|nr:ribbon-helix-helix protein, CopG family [Tepidisphaeraceae bacterium]